MINRIGILNIRCFVVVVSVICLCAAVLPAQQKKALETLRQDIEEELGSTLFDHTQAAIVIRDCTSGTLLYERNGQLLMRPASNAKIFTSAAAVFAMSKKYVLETSIATLDSGRAALVCRGGADPLFSAQDIQKLAEIAVQSGVKRLDTLYMDASLFDSVYYGDGWMWDDESDPFMPYLSPFSLDGNTIRISMKSPAQSGLPVDVSLSPSSHFIHLENALLSAKRSKLKVRKEVRSNRIKLSGTLARKKRITKRVSMWRPQDLFADLLLQALGTAGIPVDSTVIRHGTGSGVSHTLGSITRRIDPVLAEMNKESDNLCAESVLRLLALSRGKEEEISDSDGLSALKSILGKRGLDTKDLHLRDGSGISFYNLVSAETISQLLVLLSTDKEFERFASTLAVSGTDGTLKNRMKDLSKGEAFWGKTGTVSGVSALSGYAQAPRGRLLSVVILMQNFSGKHKPYREVQDNIVRHCIRYSAAQRSAKPPR